MNNKNMMRQIEVECPNCEHRDVPVSPLDNGGSHYCFKCDTAFDPRITEFSEKSFKKLNMALKQAKDSHFENSSESSELTEQAIEIYIEAVEQEYYDETDSK